MDPEETYQDAIDAINEWRQELRAKRPQIRERLTGRRTRRVWLDTGTGPGVEVLAPDED